MQVRFDAGVASAHASKATGRADSLTGLTSGAGAQDISAAYGVMCQFLAPNFMDMADAMDEALESVRSQIASAASGLTSGTQNMADVDVETDTDFGNLRGNVEGL